jgi:hypothetical protein
VNGLAEEVKANSLAFASAWPVQQNKTTIALNCEEATFLRSYQRLVSFQAWRSELLESIVTNEALEFFVEAHNDAVLSHILSRQGVFRPALQTLRSCIENVLQSIYYVEHPVELLLWAKGKHRLSRVELEAYLVQHPALDGLDPSVTGLQLLSRQYGILNQAVHASARGFRMTQGTGELSFFSENPVRVRQWESNQRDVVQGCNLLLMCLHRERLTGNALPNIRKAVSLAMNPPQRAAVKKHLRITLPVQ